MADVSNMGRANALQNLPYTAAGSLEAIQGGAAFSTPINELPSKAGKRKFSAGGDSFNVGQPLAQQRNIRTRRAKKELVTTITARRFHRHYENSLLRGNLLWIRTAGADRRDAGAFVMTLPMGNYYMITGQHSDEVFQDLYSKGNTDFMTKYRDHAGYYAFGEPSPTDPERNDTSVAVSKEEINQLSSSAVHALEDYATFIGSAFDTTNINGSGRLSEVPRTSYYANGSCECHHIWDTVTRNTELFIVNVPIKRPHHTKLNLHAGVNSDYAPPYTSDFNAFITLDSDLHDFPWVKLPATRNPLYSMSGDDKTVWPFKFTKKLQALVEEGFRGRGFNRDEIPLMLDAGAKLVGKLVEPPPSFPVMDLLDRAPFDQRAIQALPVSTVAIFGTSRFSAKPDHVDPLEEVERTGGGIRESRPLDAPFIFEGRVWTRDPNTGEPLLVEADVARASVGGRQRELQAAIQEYFKAFVRWVRETEPDEEVISAMSDAAREKGQALFRAANALSAGAGGTT